MKNFEELLVKMTAGNKLNGIAKHFALAFCKVFLNCYINKFAQLLNLREFEVIDDILSRKDNMYCANLRFYCAKLLRTKMTLK